MPTEQRMHHCQQCDKQTIHLERTPNHILHLVATFLTGGLWVIPWIIISNSNQPLQCTICGHAAQQGQAQQSPTATIVGLAVSFILICAFGAFFLLAAPW
ncbi:hypothetical protein [uncultured Desulfuromonas sp.]|uniref:hypothetical protein n=1 Tax=uncultured Desulfuromonas sp. TaxID=181013 RepID=UPI002AAB6346|nr:hypothetical protein [uncultured Desulfuromonas sp.]